MGSRNCDGNREWRIGIQSGNDAGDGLVYLISVAGTQNRLSSMENVPRNSYSRLEVLVVLAVGVAHEYERNRGRVESHESAPCFVGCHVPSVAEAKFESKIGPDFVTVLDEKV